MTAETTPARQRADEPGPAPVIPDELRREADRTAAERLIFFSDAVVAIAITLLALELPVPTGGTTSMAWETFRGNYDDYLAFLISFVVVANQWFGHHRLFRYVNRVHRRMAGINMIWLLTVVVTPFATRVLVSKTAYPMAFTLYAGIQAVSQLTFLALILTIRHDRLTAATLPSGTFTPAIARAVAFTISFLVSIPIAYATHWAYAFWAVTPFLARITNFVAGRRTGGRPDHQG